VSNGHHISSGVSGALRTFGYWIANGTLGLPLLEGVDYWSVMREEPSLLEQTIAIFANVLTFDDEGRPTNAKEAERRAAMWVRQYCAGTPADPPLEPWEVALY
jgi:hypothetical protein